MHLRVQRNIEDIVAFSDHYVTHSRFVKKAITRYRLFGALAIGGISTLAICIIEPHAAMTALIVACPAALLFATQAGGIIKRHRHKMIRQLYLEGKDPNALKEADLEVLESGVIARTDTSEMRMSWDAIHEIVSTPEYTFIHLSPIRAIIIPHKKVLEGSLPALLAEIGRHYRSSQELPPGAL